MDGMDAVLHKTKDAGILFWNEVVAEDILLGRKMLGREEYI